MTLGSILDKSRSAEIVVAKDWLLVVKVVGCGSTCASMGCVGCIGCVDCADCVGGVTMSCPYRVLLQKTDSYLFPSMLSVIKYLE